jgi:hypothetical protein
MVRAHPTVLYGTNGSAGQQRDYFKQCVARNGDMPEADQSTTDGRGAATPLSPPAAR